VCMTQRPALLFLRSTCRTSGSILPFTKTWPSRVCHIKQTTVSSKACSLDYASRCVRSLFPACPVCSKVNTVFCFWRTCCYDCLKDGFGESLAFELKNVYRDRLMARFMFFLDDVRAFYGHDLIAKTYYQVDVYFDDVVPFVLDVDLQEVAIAKYV